MTFEEWWNENHEVYSRGFDIELVRIIQNFCKVSWEAALEAKKEAIELVDAWECDGCREIYDTEDYALSCCGLNHHTTTDAFKCPRCGELGRDESDMEGHWC